MTDAQLQEGIGQLLQQAHGRSTFDFEDRLLFIMGKKVGGYGGVGGETGVRGDGQGVGVGAVPTEEERESTATTVTATTAATLAAGDAHTPPHSATVLTIDQQQQYTTQGFVGPVDVLSLQQATDALHVLHQYQERVGAGGVGAGGRSGGVGEGGDTDDGHSDDGLNDMNNNTCDDASHNECDGITNTNTNTKHDIIQSFANGAWRFKSHLVLPWVWELVHHPRIVAVCRWVGVCVDMLLGWSLFPHGCMWDMCACVDRYFHDTRSTCSTCTTYIAPPHYHPSILSLSLSHTHTHTNKHTNTPTGSAGCIAVQQCFVLVY